MLRVPRATHSAKIHNHVDFPGRRQQNQKKKGVEASIPEAASSFTTYFAHRELRQKKLEEESRPHFASNFEVELMLNLSLTTHCNFSGTTTENRTHSSFGSNLFDIFV